MKKILFVSGFILFALVLRAQTTYPIPEYSNEIYLVKKDSGTTLMRLEKGASQQQMKVKMMGIGGMDQGYALDGESSTVRLQQGPGLLFVLFTGSPAVASDPQNDSMMKANGMDLSAMNNAMSSMMDPTQSLSLYSMTSGKGQRKALLQSVGLMGKSKKTATKYTLSIKKAKDGFWEIKVDKQLPHGEYTFVMMGMGMDQQYSLFAFAVE